jgi:hypothetical protein
MDLGDATHDNGFGDEDLRPRELPKDLPRSLNDRFSAPQLPAEAEMYDGWQGTHRFRPSPPQLCPKAAPQ